MEQLNFEQTNMSAGSLGGLIKRLLRFRGLKRFHYSIPDSDRDEQEKWND